MAGLEFEFNFRSPPRGVGDRGDDDRPMRILVIGDFSGRAARGIANLSDLDRRPTPAVDVDNFDALLGKVAPALQLRAGTAGTTAIDIGFHSLEDFHPDQLYRRLPMFEDLRAIRAGLQQHDSFDDAAQRLRQRVGLDTPAEIPAAAAALPGTEDDGATMDRLLGRTASAPAATAATAPASGLQAMLRDIVAPHIARIAPAHQAQYLAAADAAVAQQMRDLLHAPTFQALEANWRALRWMVAELDLGENLRLHLLDTSKDELRADLKGAGADLEQSALYRLLVDKGSRAPGGKPWDLIAGCFEFGMNDADIDLLAFLGAVAMHAGGPLIANAHDSMVGCESIAATPDPRDWQAAAPEIERRWQALRMSVIAPAIGLALPRVLLRQPYGAKTDAIDSFPFEETAGDLAHASLLWGNAGLACALLIGRAFLSGGWGMDPNDERDLGDLPAYIHEVDGERELYPVAEAHMSERAAEAMLARGLIPVAGLKTQNAARLLRFQSIAEPAAGLAGAWAS